MKILLASDTWSPMVNGVVRSVELLYHQLLALGHDVRVVTLAQNGHSHEENGILYVAASARSGSTRACGSVRRALCPSPTGWTSWKPGARRSSIRKASFLPLCWHSGWPAGATARWYIPTILSTRIIPSTFSSVSVWAGWPPKRPPASSRAIAPSCWPPPKRCAPCSTATGSAARWSQCPPAST